MVCKSIDDCSHSPHCDLSLKKIPVTSIDLLPLEEDFLGVYPKLPSDLKQFPFTENRTVHELAYPGNPATKTVGKFRTNVNFRGL